MKETIYIGIDVGSKGVITAMMPDGTMKHSFIVDDDRMQIVNFLKGLKEAGDCRCCMEEIHAVFGSSAKATFSFGEIFGYLKGVVFALGIPMTLVPPKTWQAEMWVASEKVYETKAGKRKVCTKETSINAARRLFPTHDLRRSERCTKIDDNLVDSILIAEYARRKNL